MGQSEGGTSLQIGRALSRVFQLQFHIRELQYNLLKKGTVREIQMKYNIDIYTIDILIELIPF